METENAIPPQNLDAEQSVLGACLLDNSVIDFVADAIAPEDFYKDSHRIIFMAMQALHARVEAIDNITLADELKTRRELERAGGRAYLSTLLNCAPNASNVRHHCRVIRKMAVLRGMKVIAMNIIRDIEEHQPEPETLIEETIHSLREISGEVAPRRKLWTLVRDYVDLATGVFTTQDLINQFNLRERKEKNNLAQVLHKLHKEGIIEKVGNRNGHYRKLETSLVRMNLENPTRGEFDITLPLELNNLVRILPKNIIILAGYKNAGKTSFLLNIAHDNLNKHQIRYMNSEAGDLELTERVEKFFNSKALKSEVEWIDRSNSFSDAIIPDGLNIIDYMELDPERTYMVTQYIRDIHDKLTTGVAVIALQKKKNLSYGVGGEGSLEKARLYITLDNNIARIVKAKNWRDTHQNPNGLGCNYKLIQGSQFMMTTPWDIMEDDAPKARRY